MNTAWGVSGVIARGQRGGSMHGVMGSAHVNGTRTCHPPGLFFYYREAISSTMIVILHICGFVSPPGSRGACGPHSSSCPCAEGTAGSLAWLDCSVRCGECTGGWADVLNSRLRLKPYLARLSLKLLCICTFTAPWATS